MRGYVGGVGILWDPNRVNFEGIHGNQCFISTDFKVIGFSLEGVLTNVYRHHNTGEKMSFITVLQKIHEETERRHWILGGDFNLITSLDEKKGGRCWSEEECEIFRDTIEDLRLVDITPSEGRFTWNNKRKGDSHIASLQDRFLVSKSIIDLGSELQSSIILG